MERKKLLNYPEYEMTKYNMIKTANDLVMLIRLRDYEKIVSKLTEEDKKLINIEPLNNDEQKIVTARITELWHILWSTTYDYAVKRQKEEVDINYEDVVNEINDMLSGLVGDKGEIPLSNLSNDEGWFCPEDAVYDAFGLFNC